MANRLKKIKISNKLLYILFTFITIIYISTLKLRPYPFSYIVKIIPLIILIVLVYNNFSSKKRRILIGALLFSAAGDIILALDGRMFFVYGLVCFAIAHCFYIVAFLQSFLLKKVRLIYAGLFILYGVIISSILIPGLDAMLYPVTVYLIIILCMGITSAINKNNHFIIIIGALLFMISDSIIAFNMFYTRIPFSSFWIMITYFPAQFLIIFGSIKSMNKINKVLQTNDTLKFFI